MATTLLEQTRAAHEEIERLERVIVKDFRNQPKTHKDKLLQAHRVRAMLDTMQAQSSRLVTIYQDEDGARKEEIAALRGDNVFANFYERLKEVRDYHRRHPDMQITEPENDEELLQSEPMVVFSGEEAFGRYLDLHELFNTFINSKFGRQMDYMEYLENLTDFVAIARQQRLTRQYRQYLTALLGYLESFYQRTQPLGSIVKHYGKLESEFNSQWLAGQVAGWTDDGPSLEGGIALMAPGALDLDAFDSQEELETLGPERLKEALKTLGLKCGGTLKERAARLFSTKGKSLDQIDKKLFAKGFLPAGSTVNVVGSSVAREAALLEAKVCRLCDVLADVVRDTKGNVEKKQARTYEEMQNELREAEQDVADEDESDEEEYIYNPLKLPLGWDGKPIPYWLYKLHGLNQEFKCEICGGKSYWGRRAFERHFKESQHQNAMRSNGIPNNKMFFEITQLEDAIQLWQNIQEREKGGFRPETDEEYEDEDGNVYNKKTYEDLKRQGLI